MWYAWRQQKNSNRFWVERHKGNSLENLGIEVVKKIKFDH
jgi:hypothetical protein